MTEYHKIQTVFKRNPETKHKTLLLGEYSMPELGYLKDNKWVWTEKVDGTNIRIMFQCGIASPRQGEIRGKTDNAQIHPQLMEIIMRKFGFGGDMKSDELFQTLEDQRDVVFYGEGYGPKIQSGGKYSQEHSFVLFDIKIGEWWLRRGDVEDIAGKHGLEVVPVVGSGTLLEMVERVKKGFKSQWGDFEAEGIVAKPTVELRARNGERIITKLKTKDFRA